MNGIEWGEPKKTNKIQFMHKTAEMWSHYYPISHLASHKYTRTSVLSGKSETTIMLLAELKSNIDNNKSSIRTLHLKWVHECVRCANLHTTSNERELRNNSSSNEKPTTTLAGSWWILSGDSAMGAYIIRFRSGCNSSNVLYLTFAAVQQIFKGQKHTWRICARISTNELVEWPRKTVVFSLRSIFIVDVAKNTE